jgi:mRNA interferase MazF
VVAKGDVVLVNFPFTDLSQVKLRPAIVLWVDLVGSDVVVCAVTSQKVDQLSDGEFPLNIANPEFSVTGLRVPSKVRVTRLVTLERQMVIRKLGKLGEASLQKLNRHMVKAFKLSKNTL